MSSEKKQES